MRRSAANRTPMRAQAVASNSHMPNDAERGGGHCTRLRDSHHILRVTPAQYCRRAPAPIRRFLKFVEPPNSSRADCLERKVLVYEMQVGFTRVVVVHVPDRLGICEGAGLH